MNVFSEIFYSIAGVKRYPEFLKNKKGKVFLYVTIVVLIYLAIANVRTIPNTMNVVSELQEAIMNFPDFHLKSGKLQIEESFSYENDHILVVMESENGSYIKRTSESDWRTALSYYESVFVMDETTLLVKNNGEIDIYDYPADLQISRDWVYDKIDYIYLIVAIYIVFSYIFSLIGYFLTALFVALVGMIICSFSNQKLTFGQLYLLSIYAKTLPLFIKGLLKLISYNFFGFFIVAFAIACLYLGLAIHRMDMLEKENNRVDGPIIF